MISRRTRMVGSLLLVIALVFFPNSGGVEADLGHWVDDEDWIENFLSLKGDLRTGQEINEELEDILEEVARIDRDTSDREVRAIKDRMGEAFDKISGLEDSNDRVLLNDRLYRIDYYMDIRLQPEDTHQAYMTGYEDGTIKPYQRVTREEAAAMISRILPGDSDLEPVKDFVDVSPDRWSYDDIMRIVRLKYFKGYPGNKFNPGGYITRAETVTMLTRAVPHEEDTGDLMADLIDVRGHWAEEAITCAVNNGWVEGFPNKTFMPDWYINRAEIVTLINKALGRGTSLGDMYKDRKTYKDIDEGEWYYEDIMEAVTSHRYTIIEGREVWID